MSGIQIINVAMGVLYIRMKSSNGTLCHDSDTNGMGYIKFFIMQSKLSVAIGHMGNSFHHQAIKVIALGFDVVGWPLMA